MSRPAQGGDHPGGTVFVTLPGRFTISVAGRAAGPWPRPAARRLCELVLVSPGRRVSREAAWEDCLEIDPTSEEAASALIRVYTAQGVRIGIEKGKK